MSVDSWLSASDPPVSHSCNRTVRSSRYIVFERKSMPGSYPLISECQATRKYRRVPIVAW